jgi:ATP-dependent RNA helicase RhlE
MPFAALGLRAELVRAVSDLGYAAPSPIQAACIPAILAGRDLLAAAQTGTGKTAGFALPLLHGLAAADASRGARAIRALILTPTRELAAQVNESVRGYGRHLGLSSTALFGGVGFEPQKARLRRPLDVLVATPGRLLDHAAQRTVDLSGVEVLVLDEADRMLDMGFAPALRRILALLPARRQNLLFSATFADGIRTLAKSLLKDPVIIEAARRNAPADAVHHTVHPVDAGRKRALLVHLIHSRAWPQVLVFTRTKHGADRLADQLGRDTIPAAALHGNKSQGARTRALAAFKTRELRVLVATDIAARGLDIAELPQVVNFDLPNIPEDYVHRIGRTGRAGQPGSAVSLVSAQERPLLAAIEALLGRRVVSEAVPGYEPGTARPNEGASDRSGDAARAAAESRRHPPAVRPPARAPAPGGRRRFAPRTQRATARG